MYIPKYFKVNNVEEILDFIQKNSFGTIITTEQGKPIATHLPLQLIKEEDTYYITGHIVNGHFIPSKNYGVFSYSPRLES